MDQPPPLPAPPRTTQFGIRYLVYVTTLAAVMLGFWKSILAPAFGRDIPVELAICGSFLFAYFAIRWPILLRRFARGREAIAARRRTLIEQSREAKGKSPE